MIFFLIQCKVLLLNMKQDLIITEKFSLCSKPEETRVLMELTSNTVILAY